MDIEQRDPAELVPADYNPRKIDDHQLDALKRSLDRWGFVEPVVMNKRTGRIVGGHQRVKAALALAVPEVPTVWVDIDEEGEKALNIALNQISGEWEEDKLAALLDELEAKGQSLEELGFKQDRLDDLLAELRQGPELQGDLDEVPEPPAEPITQPGDLWQLGEHRLLCGDSTKAEDVARLMDGEKADVVYTDPPYGMNLDTDYSSEARLGKGLYKGKDMSRSGGVSYDQVLGDKEDFRPELINAVFEHFGDCKEIFLWGADYYAELIPSRKEGSWIVWDKVTKADGEVCGVADFHGSNFELCWSKAKHKRDLARIIHKGLASVENDKRQHPTQKPVALAEWVLSRWAKEGALIVDLFSGSGSHLLACEKLGFACRAMELSPAYCDVAVARWEKATGRKAERLPADG
jgi:DNA modification methylase